jgi:outer membrane protein assembly factor BamB
MRILRRILITLVALFALTAAGLWTYDRIERQRALEQQAEAIAAHRETQRAAAPAAPGIGQPSAPVVGAAPDAPVGPGMTWTAHWRDFRGERRDGQYRGEPIRTDWAALSPVWQQPVGRGHSSFVAGDGRAFTIEQRGANEVAAAYDVLTGRELWTHTWPAAFHESGGGSGPRATPTLHEGTLFALGATGELRALDAATGTLRWRANILEDADADNLERGMTGSPLVAGKTIVTVPGGKNGRSVVAYDRSTGRVAWSALDDHASYASPMRVTLAGVDQIVVFLATRLVGLSADQGALLWESPWPLQSSVAAQPLPVGDNRIFASTGDDAGGAMIEITRDGDRLTAREVWRTNRMKNNFSSSVHHEGFIYGLDQGILACIDAATGEFKWKAGRYGHGQMLLASGHLVITTEEGEVAVARATPAGHEELARVPALDGRTYNHPALVDGFLLVRNGAQMAAFDLRRK